MAILGIFSQQPQVPTVNSILPDIAKQEIINGRLPILNTDKLSQEEREQGLDNLIVLALESCLKLE